MSNFNWCHGPSCHTKHTQDRIRGVKGSKVLRTKKVPYYGRDVHQWINNFCSQNCLMDFINKYINDILAIAPRTECLETPIEVTKETYSNHWGTHVRTNIKEINSNIN